MLPLTPWTRCPVEPVGSVGVEPTPPRLKGVYAAFTPRPPIREVAAFQANHGRSPHLHERRGLSPPGQARRLVPREKKKARHHSRHLALQASLRRKLGVTSAADEREGHSP